MDKKELIKKIEEQRKSKQTPQGLIQVPQKQVMWKVVGQGWK